MHTTIEVTEKAVQAFPDIVSDCVISLGGGSTTGLGKAIAVPTRLPPSPMSSPPAGTGLWDFVRAAGAPMRPADLALQRDDLPRATAIAMKNKYWNPRPFDEAAILALLQAAWKGTRPAS